MQESPSLFRLEDRYATGNAAPLLDDTQDKTLLWATQAEGVTSFAFTMPTRNCGDNGQDVLIPHDRFVTVLYAYGEEGDSVRRAMWLHGTGRL